MNTFFLSLLLLVTLSAPRFSQATLIQILHTNDTHSYLEPTIHDNGLGGMAEMKALIDFYKNKATKEGVKTLTLDAGDFSEGTFNYMANRGRRVFQIHNEMGYDLGTLGNHDYLMGTTELDKILGEMDMKMSFILANITAGPQLKNIHNKIAPYKEMEIDGIKIAFLGLTTDQIFYKWRFGDGGQITPPYKAAKYYEQVLKNRKNDFIIALTHLGTYGDVILAEQTKYIDLIIGGHSHTALFRPAYGLTKQLRQVPIVQAGMHTQYLGRLVIDLQKGQPLKIVSYELIPVKYEAYDPHIKELIEAGNDDLNKSYGKEWLEQKVGYSDLAVGDKDGFRKWGYFITDAIREKTNADIGIHVPFMNADDYPVGDISRRDIFNSFPRIFEITQKYGWSIYTTQVKGLWLRSVFNILMNFKQPLLFSGITVVEKKDDSGKIKKHLMVNGKEIDPKQLYTVALTEGIVRGAEAATPLAKQVLHDPKESEYKVWATLEEKLAKELGHLSFNNMTDTGHATIMPSDILY